MSYSSLSNQLFHMGHFLFSIFLLFNVLPRFIFIQHQKVKMDQWVSNFFRMVLLVIVMGYCLVLLKLFEVLAIGTIFILLILKSLIPKNKESQEEFTNRGMTWFLDYLDGLISPFTHLLTWYREKRKSWRGKRAKFSFVHTQILILCFTLAVVLYIRFYNAWINAAPSMSDAYVTLAWMKYISGRELFHDGIYPQGFHIYLATIKKFAAIDALYILNYMGPFNSFLITVGFYFLTVRWVKHFPTALVAVLTYGILGIYTPMGWERQVASNSQEFAFLFVFPSMFFLKKYFMNGKQKDLLTFSIGITITGLVHSFAYAFAVMATASLSIAYITMTKGRGDCVKKVITIILSGALVTIISLIPMGIGFLLGKSYHASTVNYLFEQGQVFNRPTLHFMDYLALSSLLIQIGRNRWIRNKDQKLFTLFTIWFGGSLFFLYYFGGSITHSVLIDSRSGDLWALGLPICIAGGFLQCYLILRRIKWLKRKLRYVVPLVLSSILLLSPPPINPYKMEWNSSVEQYLRITESYRPKTWTIISQEEGYALTFDGGFHMYLSDLLNNYDPTKISMTRNGKHEPDPYIPKDIFIFREKKIFMVSKTNSIYEMMKPKYERRELENKKLEDWMRIYTNHFSNMSIYYEDDNLIVYHLHRDLTKDEKSVQIWGESKN